MALKTSDEIADTFPSEWKKANIAPVFKKGDKQLFKKIVQFPITGKTFEGLLYNQMFEIFIRTAFNFSETVLFETRRFLNKTTFCYHS